MTEHILYRFYSRRGRLLYVGITMNPFTRFSDHRRTQRWWDQVGSVTLIDWEDREQLKMMERYVIETERPLYNVIHSVHNPDWADYADYCHYCNTQFNGEPADTREVPYDMYISDADGRIMAEFKCSRNPEHEYFCTYDLDVPIAPTLRHEWVLEDGSFAP